MDKEVINLLKRVTEHFNVIIDSRNECEQEKLLKEIDLIISKGELEDNSDWISVKDELPEKDVQLIAYVGKREYGHQFSGITTTQFEGIDSGYWPYITHWQPLPEAPIQTVNG